MIKPTFIDYNRELADYFGMPVGDVNQRRSDEDFTKEWKERRISNAEQANRMYAETKSNLFRQARPREKRLILYRRILKDILTTQVVKELKISRSGDEYRNKIFAPYTKNTVLDYGCGIGDVGLAMAMLGYEVDLLEIGNSELEKFIRWRFDRRYLPCNFIPYGGELKRDRYEIVVCIDVLEHHEDPERAMVDIFNSMKAGGYLFLRYGWFEREMDYSALGHEDADEDFIKPFLKKNFLQYDKYSFWHIKRDDKQ